MNYVIKMGCAHLVLALSILSFRGNSNFMTSTVPDPELTGLFMM